MLTQKRIHVTSADIANGIFQHEEECPIALALQRAYPDLYIRVRTTCIRVFVGGIPTPEYPLPPRITKWINNYDDQLPAQPIEFTFPSFEE